MQTFITLRPSCHTETDFFSSCKGLASSNPEIHLNEAISNFIEELGININILESEARSEFTRKMHLNVVGAIFRCHFRNHGIQLVDHEAFQVQVQPNLAFFRLFYPFPDPTAYFNRQLDPESSDHTFFTGMCFNNDGLQTVTPCNFEPGVDFQAFTEAKVKLREASHRNIYCGRPPIRDNFIHCPRNEDEMNAQYSFYLSQL